LLWESQNNESLVQVVWEAAGSSEVNANSGVTGSRDGVRSAERLYSYFLWKKASLLCVTQTVLSKVAVLLHCSPVLSIAKIGRLHFQRARLDIERYFFFRIVVQSNSQTHAPTHTADDVLLL
ncbi:unnamed protein product, partial [Pylaiella littoralis]